MIVQINENFRIIQSTNSFDLEELKLYEDKDSGEKKENWQKVSYCSTLGKAIINAYKLQCLSKEEVVRFKELEKFLLGQFKELEDKIINNIK